MGETFWYTDPKDNQRALNDGSVTFLLGRAGFGTEQVQPIGDRTPYLAGVTERGIYTGPRSLLIKIGIKKSSQAALAAFERTLRSDLNAYIDEDNLGTLRVVTADSVTRDIDCWPVGYPDDSAQRRVLYAERVLRFWAPEPWFYDPVQQSEEASLDVGGGLQFNIFVGAGTIQFDDTDIDDVKDIHNQGDVDTWPVVRITGAGSNPVITNNTTDSNVTITQAMDADDYVEVDMKEGTIVFYDDSLGTTTSILSSLSSDSEFWPLIRGHNLVQLQLTAGAGATILITWYDRYLGI